jgi:D-alanyl-D-alanine carboxypeptidase
VFGDGTFGHTGTIESTHAMVVDRPGGVTWSVLVSGGYPGSTGNLRTIFDEAASDAGLVL